MSSLILCHSLSSRIRFLSSSSPVSSSSPLPIIYHAPLRISSLVQYHPNNKGKCSLKACAGASGEGSFSREKISPSESMARTRKEVLLEYVKNVQPEFMELFTKRASQQIVEAMRQTVTNMLGTLPPQFFVVTITTVAENIAQLMYSVMMTGYMFKNAQYRLELQQCLQATALPEASDRKEEKRDYAPRTQKNVSGDVIRWNDVSGAEKIEAKVYIELLEAEIEELKQITKKSVNGQNTLLDYLRSLEPQNLKELTSSAGEDVVLAMNTFITRLLAVSNPAQMKTTPTETNATELATLLYWLMVVGYSIRSIEVRWDMERVLGASPKLAELPPGEKS